MTVKLLQLTGTIIHYAVFLLPTVTTVVVIRDVVLGTCVMNSASLNFGTANY